MTIIIIDRSENRANLRARRSRNLSRMQACVRDAMAELIFDSIHDEGAGACGDLFDEFLTEMSDKLNSIRNEYHDYLQSGGMWGWQEYVAHHKRDDVETYFLESNYAKKYTRTERENAVRFFLDGLYD